MRKQGFSRHLPSEIKVMASILLIIQGGCKTFAVPGGELPMKP